VLWHKHPFSLEEGGWIIRLRMDLKVEVNVKVDVEVFLFNDVNNLGNIINEIRDFSDSFFDSGTSRVLMELDVFIVSQVRHGNSEGIKLLWYKGTAREIVNSLVSMTVELQRKIKLSRASLSDLELIGSLASVLETIATFVSLITHLNDLLSFAAVIKHTSITLILVLHPDSVGEDKRVSSERLGNMRHDTNMETVPFTRDFIQTLISIFGNLGLAIGVSNHDSEVASVSGAFDEISAVFHDLVIDDASMIVLALSPVFGWTVSIVVATLGLPSTRSDIGHSFFDFDRVKIGQNTMVFVVMVSVVNFDRAGRVALDAGAIFSNKPLVLVEHGEVVIGRGDS